MSKVKKVAILQSNYIPWKGYFDIINSVDEFILYDTAQYIRLSFLTSVCELLGVKTALSWSSDFRLVEGRSERLLGICKDAGATTYLSGSAARDYLDADLFEQAGVRLEWIDYGGYPEYRQLYPPFEHGVSILDLLFNGGLDASNFRKQR